MLYWLLQNCAPFLDELEFASGDSRVLLTARTALASLTSFLIAVLMGPRAIRFLKNRFRERVDSASARLNELHAAKNATPTMGGLFVVGAILVATLLWGDLANVYVRLGLFVAVGFAALGAADDWVKLRSSRRGLSARQKLAVQILLAAVVGIVLYTENRGTSGGTDLVWPIGGRSWPLGAGFICWAVLVTVGSSNAVNLTDGLDGLASGCTVFAGSAMTALAYLAGHRLLAEYVAVPHVVGCGELCVVLGATVGAMLGFLWFNCHPAQVFMGDTGSLPVGALLALGALATKQEVLLAVCGGVFVIETLSVILQVGCYKLTGKRLIACSPLHNHYVFKGEPETRIVVRFWIGSALLAIAGMASLKIR